MNLNLIKQLIEMLQSSQLTVLEVQEESFRIRMEQRTGLQSDISVIAPLQQEPPKPQVVSQTADESGCEVKSPMVGIFHMPKEKIKIGDILKKGQTACIIEAMKLMNNIDMAEDGEIIEIAVKEGDMVEFNQLLFRYNKTGE
ncbi:MAG: acetyl-CoA carboxylase biotin carboxyl carrier protein subunit [Lachnospiraceae bacterium]|nr:acetyl-CoA carboxylase biotin carboxyl carrier protein subunit [Lachnospiraceae bacterium]